MYFLSGPYQEDMCLHVSLLPNVLITDSQVIEECILYDFPSNSDTM